MIEVDDGHVQVSPDEARALLVAGDVDGLVAVVAYAEALAVLLAGVGVVVARPEELVRRALDDTLARRAPWSPAVGSVAGHLQRHVRTRFAAAILVEAQARGPRRDPWAARLSVVQVGDLRGLELVAHYAGEMARSFRRSDREVRATAARLATYLQTCLRAFAEDTAPIPQPVFVDVVVADRGSGGEHN